MGHDPEVGSPHEAAYLMHSFSFFFQRNSSLPPRWPRSDSPSSATTSEASTLPCREHLLKLKRLSTLSKDGHEKKGKMKVIVGNVRPRSPYYHCTCSQCVIAVSPLKPLLWFRGHRDHQRNVESSAEQSSFTDDDQGKEIV